MRRAWEDGGMSANNLSNVWFKVTDLEVASGEGSWVTTTSGERYLDFSGGIAVTSTGHAHPHVAEAIAAQAQRFIHAQANVYTHDLMQPLAARLAELSPGRHRHVLLRQLRRRDHRGRGEARQAGDRPTARHRVPGQLPRPDASGDGDDHVEDRVPRRSRAAAVGCVHRPVPRRARRRRGGRGRAGDRRVRRPPHDGHGAERDRSGDHRAGPRRRRLHGGAGGFPRGDRRAVQGVRHAVHRRRGAVGFRAHREDVRHRALRRRRPTSCAWPRGSRRASRSRRSARAASSTTSGRPARTAAPTAAIRSVAPPRSRRSTCSPPTGSSITSNERGAQLADGLRALQASHEGLVRVRSLGPDGRGRSRHGDTYGRGGQPLPRRRASSS